MPIEDLIQREVQTLEPDATCIDAAKLMREEEIGSVVIEDDGVPLGIVTDRDLVARAMALGLDPEKTPVREVMSEEPIFLEGDRSIENATETMGEYGIRRLIIVDDEGMLEGLLSLDDLFQLLAEEVQLLARATTIVGIR
jgi:CBS domain-containing protein